MNETQPAHTDESHTGISGTREKLDIARCQYGVPCSSAYKDGYMADCGDPAIAKWSWGKHGSMFVCETHDRIVEEAENEPSQALSDSEIEQLSQQEALPEGWTEYSEHETAFQKVKRVMNEQKET